MAKLTIYFEDPFWVGLVERDGPDGPEAARVVFGAEPSLPQLLAWSRRDYPRLRFNPAHALDEGARPRSPKRAQREAARALMAPSLRTHAQEQMRVLVESRKQQAEARSRERRREQAEARFAHRQEKRKRKRRGH